MRSVFYIVLVLVMGLFARVTPTFAQNSDLDIGRLCIEYGDHVSPSVKAALLTLLGEVPGLDVSRDIKSCRGQRSVVLAIGETGLARALIPNAEMVPLKRGGFVHRFGEMNGYRMIGVRGKQSPSTGERVDASIGYGLFSVLESLGFAFLHPLDPVVPTKLIVKPERLNIESSPYLSIRGIHLHTMHPIELTNVLNGWGLEGPYDETGFVSMLIEWRRFLTWMLANGQNRVQWVLLSSPKWQDFSTSTLRQQRLKKLVDIAHDFGVEVGVDVPIAMRQQNAFRLITKQGRLADETAQIKTRIDWLMAAGFDFLASENGTTEFTHPNPQRMLAWMDTVALHLDEQYGKRAYMKVHVSSGQRSRDYVDPVDGGPLNINFLPYYADSRLGVMPHTVEYYGLKDTAPTYGNRSFGHIVEYMKRERGRREVIWYPETAYWCSFDIDVPLFLPVYGQRRLQDMREIASWRKGNADPVDGQMVFSSGWAWGYWLNDVVAARAAWNPLLHLNDDVAFKEMLVSLFENLGDVKYRLSELIAETAGKQADWLIRGANDASGVFKPALTGQAYLQGEDTLDDLARLLKHVPRIALSSTQPDRNGLFYGYAEHVEDLPRLEALLSDMKQGHQIIAEGFAEISSNVPKSWKKNLRDLALSSQITALRAYQMHALFHYALLSHDGSNTTAAHPHAVASRRVIREAKTIVEEAELLYRLDPDRVAAWGDNPTAYRYGYLWTVRHLYYFERDHRRLVDKEKNLCFGNVVDPFELSFGYAADSPQFAPLRRILNLVFDEKMLDGCFNVSKKLQWEIR